VAIGDIQELTMKTIFYAFLLLGVASQV